jgi:hypothetical protein
MALFYGGERTTSLTFFSEYAIIIIVNEKERKLK